MAKLTLQELLDRKEALKNKKKKKAEIYVESIDAEILVESPTKALITEAVGMGEGDDGDRGDAYLILNCIKEPNLKDKGIQESYGCVEPLDIVGMVFEPGEIGSIAQEIMKLAGYGNNVHRVVGKELKN